MFTRSDILFGFIAPFVLAAVLMLIARRGWNWPAAAGVAAAVLIAFAACIERPSLKPSDSLGWIWVIAIAAFGAGALASVRRIPFLIFAAAAVSVAIGGTWLFLRPLIPHTWSMPVGLAWISGIGLCIAMIGLMNEPPARRGGRFSVLLCLFFIAATSAGSLAISGSVKLGLLGGALTAGTAGMTIAAAWRRPAGYHGLLFVFQVMLASLIMYGHFYASLSPAPAVLLLVSPMFIFVPEWMKQSGWRADAIRLVAVLIPLAIAGGMAYREHARKMDDPTGYYYSRDTGIQAIVTGMLSGFSGENRRIDGIN